MNRHVRVEAGVHGTIVVVAAYCPSCRQEVMPRVDGVCTWCDTLIVDEDSLSARAMLGKLGALPERVVELGVPALPAPTRSRSAPRKPSSKWTGPAIIAAFQAFAVLWERTPTSTDCKTSALLPSPQLVRREFMSHKLACDAAGLARPVTGTRAA